MLYQHRGDYDRVIECCETILKHVEQCEPVTFIDTLILLGDTWRMRGDYTAALGHFAKAETSLRTFLKSNCELYEARIALGRGFIYSHIDNDDAEDELDKSFHRFDRRGDMEGRAAAQVYLGIHKLGKKEFAVAEEMFEQALSVSLMTLSSIIRSSAKEVATPELPGCLACVSIVCSGLLIQSQQRYIQKMNRHESAVDLPMFLCKWRHFGGIRRQSSAP